MSVLSASRLRGPLGGVYVGTRSKRCACRAELGRLLAARARAKRQDRKFFDVAIFWREWLVSL